MDTPSPPECEHVSGRAGANDGLSAQPLEGEEPAPTCSEVTREHLNNFPRKTSPSPLGIGLNRSALLQ